MKSWILLLALLVQVLDLMSQKNLVPNPSFEEYTVCPNIDTKPGATGWINTLGNDSLYFYFNACSSDLSFPFSVPFHNFHYVKYPRTGNAYFSLWLYGFIGRSPWLNKRNSYVSTKLQSPLEEGVQYYVRFYTSPESIVEDSIKKYPCFMDRIGASLSKEMPQASQLLNFKLPRENYIGHAGSLLSDIDIWTPISGCIIGDGEEFLTLGAFHTIEETLFGEDCYNYAPNRAHYYFEDVGVYKMDVVPDTVYVCSGELYRLGGQFLDASYQWNTGSKDSVIYIEESGLYTVHVQLDACSFIDSVLVIAEDRLDEYLPRDTVFCRGEILEINIPFRNGITWSTGSSSPTEIINVPGKYQVSVENDCGRFIGEMDVSEIECECMVLTSNVFSPKIGGVNGEMVYQMSCPLAYEIKSLEVFDRWGNVVYKVINTDQSEIKWNGQRDGKYVQAGVYIWRMTYEYERRGRKIRESKYGDVTVLY